MPDMPEQPKVRGAILIAEDDPQLRALLSSLLEQASYPTIEASSGEEALRAARAEQPLLVILDVSLPVASGYEVCRELRDEFGGALPIMFVSGTRTEPFDRAAGLLVGADDYLVNPFDPAELLARVRCLLRRPRLEPGRPSVLTEREHEVLQLLAEGLTHREIADRLVISPRTVETHITHILGKLGVHSRAQAIALAYRTQMLAQT